MNDSNNWFVWYMFGCFVIVVISTAIMMFYDKIKSIIKEMAMNDQMRTNISYMLAGAATCFIMVLILAPQKFGLDPHQIWVVMRFFRKWVPIAVILFFIIGFFWFAKAWYRDQTGNDVVDQKKSGVNQARENSEVAHP